MNTSQGVTDNVLLDKVSILRIPFLFLLTYFFLYCNSGKFLTGFLFEWIYSICVPPFASVLGVDDLTRISKTGSGDTPFHFYQIFFMLVLSVFISIGMWVVLQKKAWLQTITQVIFNLMRYYLAYQMIIYGMAKVFYLQFQFPNDMLLERTLGDMSPMGLMWTFMGYSKGYTMFVGWLEVIGGLLLIFRSTTILGALATFGVMLNVFMLNMCYDVPVKLLSFNMVAMSVFILFFARHEVGNFFFSRGEVARNSLPFFDYREYGPFFFWIKVGLLSFLLIRMGTFQYLTSSRLRSTNILTGKYEVISHQKLIDGEYMDVQNDEKWESISSIGPKMTALKMTQGETRGMKTTINNGEAYIIFKTKSKPIPDTLHYEVDSLHIISLTGLYYGDSTNIRLQKSKDDFLLKTRKFSWMQEYPFNR